MLVAEKPAVAAADDDDDDDEVTSDDEVMAPSFWDASRNMLHRGTCVVGAGGV